MKYILLILAFCIATPALAYNVYGGDGANLSTTQESYMSVFGNGAVQTGTVAANFGSQIIPFAGTTCNFSFDVNVGPGTGATWTFSIMQNEATSSLPSCSVTGLDPTLGHICQIQGCITHVAGDRIAWAAVPSTGTTPTATTLAEGAVEFPQNGINEVVLGNRISGNLVSNAFDFGPAMNTGISLVAANESSSSEPIAVAGTAGSLYTVLSGVTGGFPYQSSLRDNSATTTLITYSNNANVVSDLADSVAIAANDLINFSFFSSSTPTARQFNSGFAFTPTNPLITGVYIGSSLTAFETQNAAVSFNVSGDRGVTATAANATALTAASTVFTNISCSVDVAPGIGQNKTFQLFGGIWTAGLTSKPLVCIIAGATKTCNASGFVEIPAFYRINIRDTLSVSAAVGHPSCSLAAEDPPPAFWPFWDF